MAPPFWNKLPNAQAVIQKVIRKIIPKSNYVVELSNNTNENQLACMSEKLAWHGTIIIINFLKFENWMYQLEALSGRNWCRGWMICWLLLKKYESGNEHLKNPEKGQNTNLGELKQTELQVKVKSNRLIAENDSNTLGLGDWWQSEKINKNNKKPINQQDQSKTTFPAQNAAEIKISYWA